MSNYSDGHFAEIIALNFLRFKGYSLLAKNYVTGRGTQAGEVDLIVCRGTTIVFVEVKKRRTLEEAAYSILPQQQQRIIRGAEAFLAKNPQFSNYDMRFDAVLVKLPLSIQHLENAWF